MKLDRLRYFDSEIAKDTIIGGQLEQIAIYYFFKNSFHHLHSSPNPVATELIPLLERTRKKKEYWRSSSSRRTYFYSEEFDCVLVADFLKAPKKETQEYIHLALANCARHASNAFRAAHDALTELLNRHSLEHVLNSIVTATPESSAADLTASRQVAVLAFDIDHFKQVNDTHGHLYGDIVLRTFARRMESLVSLLGRDPRYAGKVDFYVARPGGEEFTVIAAGSLADGEICDLAELFRDEIARKELPTPIEWQQYEEQGQTTGLTFPLDRERRVTCSVGVISTSVPINKGNATRAITNLLNRADLALYKAKSSGRNRVCFFPDLVKRYGRVMEVNAETGMVVIDLGNEVGLQPGQEFFVFNPKFDGLTDYLHPDGRTVKRMGTYPRIHSARIEAFDVQKEISFCHVLEQANGKSIILKDAWLEAIPLGAIGHLVKSPTIDGTISAKLVGGPLSTDAIKARIAELEAQRPFCAVFRIANEEAVISQFGTASVNKILAELFNSLHTSFPTTAAIGYLQPTQFVLVIPASDGHYIKAISGILEKIKHRYDQKVRLVSGIFDPATAEKYADLWKGNEVNYSKSLELATILTLIAEASKKSECLVFGHDALVEIADELVNLTGREQALEDLKMLADFGIQTAWFQNSIARLAFAESDYDQALIALQEATKLPNCLAIHQGNLAIVYFHKADYLNAYSAFCAASLIHEEDIPVEYYGAWVVSANKARAAGQLVDIEKLIKLGEAYLSDPELATSSFVAFDSVLHATAELKAAWQATQDNSLN